MATFVSAGRFPLARSVLLAWREARPVVQCMFQLRFLTAALLAAATSGSGVDYSRIVPAAAAWLCATWHVYLLNGLSDQVEDRCNGSRRPLADGELTIVKARRALRLLTLAAVGFAVFASLPIVPLVLIMLGLGVLYSAGPRPQKARTGGAMAVIAAGGATTYLAGWYAGGGGAVPSRALLLVGGTMSAWMALAGMTKDLPDAVGDAAAGRRTLPVLLGERRARLVVAAMTGAVGVGAATGAMLLHTAPAFGLGLLAGAVSVAGGLTRRDPRLPYRRFMVTQYVVHLLAIAEIYF
jgi:4-hydroxybenzoate polyprenyltransferase